MFFTLEERFQTIQHEFKEKYYHHFTDEEENKLIYMDIFKEYVSSSDLVILARCEHLLESNTCGYWQNTLLLPYLSPHRSIKHMESGKLFGTVICNGRDGFKQPE